MPRGEHRFPVKYWTDEERIEARRRQDRARKGSKRPRNGPMGGAASRSGNYVREAEPPPVEVTAEAARWQDYEPSLTARVLGDPPPWRSALGRRPAA